MEHYIVELTGQEYCEGDGENAHLIGVPIVDGPFDSFERAAHEANQPGQASSIGGYAAVSVPDGEIPEDWDE